MASFPRVSRPPSGPASRPGPAPGWTLVLPLKGGPGAKSRLRAGPGLAAAIAADCLDAVLACPAVSRTIVVTADAATAATAAAAGALVAGESRPGDGLVAAVRDGVTAALGPAVPLPAGGPRAVPGGADDGRAAGGPVGVLLGDLPTLRPEDLSAGLAAVAAALREHPGAPMAVVPDAAGTGTVLLAARLGGDLDPAFGPGSLAEHVRRGAVLVEVDLPRLRQDVDTPADLDTALDLGVGPRTAAALACARSAG